MSRKIREAAERVRRTFTKPNAAQRNGTWKRGEECRIGARPVEADLSYANLSGARTEGSSFHLAIMPGTLTQDGEPNE